MKPEWQGWLHKLNKGFLGGWSRRYCALLRGTGDLVAFHTADACAAALALVHAGGDGAVSKEGKVLLTATHPDVQADFEQIQGRRALRFVIGGREGRAGESRCVTCDDPSRLHDLLLAVEKVRTRAGIEPLRGSGSAAARRVRGSGRERPESFHSADSDSDADGPESAARGNSGAGAAPKVR